MNSTRILSIIGIGASIGGGLTKQDWLFILGAAVTFINALIEYLRYRQEKSHDTGT